MKYSIGGVLKDDLRTVEQAGFDHQLFSWGRRSRLEKDFMVYPVPRCTLRQETGVGEVEMDRSALKKEGMKFGPREDGRAKVVGIVGIGMAAGVGGTAMVKGRMSMAEMGERTIRSFVETG